MRLQSGNSRAAPTRRAIRAKIFRPACNNAARFTVWRDGEDRKHYGRSTAVGGGLIDGGGYGKTTPSGGGGVV
jgi:hypothetical protein